MASVTEFQMKWWEDHIDPGFVVVKHGKLASAVRISAEDTAKDVAVKFDSVSLGDEFMLHHKILMSENSGRIEGYKIKSFGEEFEAYFVGPEETADLLGLPSRDDPDLIRDAVRSNRADLLAFLKYSADEQTAEAASRTVAASEALASVSEASPDACLIAAAIVVSASMNTAKKESLL